MGRDSIDMTGILAIETATDACSVALYRGGKISERHEIAPKRHNNLLFRQLRELLSPGDLREQGVDCIAYGAGPGSFTGLRIAAAAAQGLAYSASLPVVAVPTLATLTQSALRCGEIAQGDTVLAVLDARIREVYSAVYRLEGGLPTLIEGPFACRPSDLVFDKYEKLRAVGDGCDLLEGAVVMGGVESCNSEILPSARDMIVIAQAAFDRGDIQAPGAAQPLYVRDEITWKKLAEQGSAR